MKPTPTQETELGGEEPFVHRAATMSRNGQIARRVAIAAVIIFVVALFGRFVYVAGQGGLW